MSWLLALVAFVAFLFALPHLLRWLKPARRGAAGGITLALGLAFSSFFEPSKKAAMENIQKREEIGEADAENERDRDLS